MDLRFGILGPLQVWRDGEALPVGAAKQRLLLTCLLLEPNRPVSVDRLFTALWEDSPPKSALANVRSYANLLRRSVGGDRLRAHAPGYRLTVQPGELDVLDFRELVRQGRAAMAQSEHEPALRCFTAALDLWRGAAAENVPRTIGLEAQLDALEEQRYLAVEESARARLALGRFSEVIDGLRDALALRPTRERLWGHLMVALYGTGDVAGALTVYAEARQALGLHLGVEPGPGLTELHRMMLSRDPRLDGPVIAWRRARPRCRGPRHTRRH
ncbi:BTAD domain-containing putative transcriptional regulator [Peterkaempfera sp. SMS 1(5)a]|uniref:AfsR/SARP family transcriptional regulator n=1 Tax=Peterkaempfera podocarpi TaxID=3232308 RepID=UPI00366E63DC